jgi:hypothetical protein
MDENGPGLTATNHEGNWNLTGETKRKVNRRRDPEDRTDGD